MTHSLVAEQQHRAVSRMGLHKETRQRTYWWQNGSTGQSAEWICTRRQDDTQPSCRMAVWGSQQDGSAQRDETTHTLVAERQGGAVSRMDLHKETRRLTIWW